MGGAAYYYYYCYYHYYYYYYNNNYNYNNNNYNNNNYYYNYNYNNNNYYYYDCLAPLPSSPQGKPADGGEAPWNRLDGARTFVFSRTFSSDICSAANSSIADF